MRLFCNCCEISKDFIYLNSQPIFQVIKTSLNKNPSYPYPWSLSATKMTKYKATRNQIHKKNERKALDNETIQIHNTDSFLLALSQWKWKPFDKRKINCAKFLKLFCGINFILHSLSIFGVWKEYWELQGFLSVSLASQCLHNWHIWVANFEIKKIIWKLMDRKNLER